MRSVFLPALAERFRRLGDVLAPAWPAHQVGSKARPGCPAQGRGASDRQTF